MVIRSATWSNGTTVLSGKWWYVWASEVFVIQILNRSRVIVTHKDTPTWGRYKIITTELPLGAD
jgi:hypothetical protein